MAETSNRHDAWQAGDSYEQYMGRWSRRVAPRFLDWLGAPAGLDWLDVGAGTGALSSEVLARCAPRSLLAIDPSDGFLEKARASLAGERVELRVGDAQALPAEARSRDVVVSGLVLNFVPDKERALAEMKRVARRGARLGFYVWDYPGGGIDFMRVFWNAAIALDPAALDLGEGRRFPFCTAEGLTELAARAGLRSVECRAIEVPTVFADFEDYWAPFTFGTGPAPGYCASLAPDARERLRARLESSVPRAADGSIPMKARAWALKTTLP